MPANGAPAARRPCAGSARRVADKKSAIVSPVHGRTVETTRTTDANFQHRDVLKAGRRGVLLFGYFLLDKQEKVTRPRSGRKLWIDRLRQRIAKSLDSRFRGNDEQRSEKISPAQWPSLSVRRVFSQGSGYWYHQPGIPGPP